MEWSLPSTVRRLGLDPSESPTASAAVLGATVAACAILRPLRDEQATRLGAEALPLVFGATFVVLVLVAAFLALAARQIPPDRLMARTAGSMTVVVLGCAVAASSMAGPTASGAAFVVAFGAFNVLGVAFGWHLASLGGAAAELPGRMVWASAGAAAGAILGPAVATILVPTVGPASLVPAAAVFLVGALFAAGRLSKQFGSSAENRPLLVERGNSPGIASAAVLIVGWSTVSTILYFAQVGIVGEAIPDPDARTAWFARVDLVANAAALAFHVVAARRTERLRLPLGLAGGPLLLAAAFAALWARPDLVAVATAVVCVRVGATAVLRPGREALLRSGERPVGPATRCALDGVLFRGADAAVATVIGLASSGAPSPEHLALAGAVAAIGLSAAGFHIGRTYEQRNRHRVATGSPDLSRIDGGGRHGRGLPTRARRIIGAHEDPLHSRDR